MNRDVWSWFPKDEPLVNSFEGLIETLKKNRVLQDYVERVDGVCHVVVVTISFKFESNVIEQWAVEK